MGRPRSKIPRFPPNLKYRGIKVLKDKTWTCPSCGTRHDRGTNAAINLKCESIRAIVERDIKVITNDTSAGVVRNKASRDLIRQAIAAARIYERRIHAL